jgi:lactoylglutathione lyase
MASGHEVLMSVGVCTVLSAGMRKRGFANIALLTMVRHPPLPELETAMATRLRHIAIIVPDPEKAATFFEQAFGMTRAGTARRGIYMSDGVMNVALLKTEGDEKPGLYHFGMWVDDLDEAEKKVTDAGGTYLAGRPTSPNSFYEAKYRNPDGVVFDLTHHGWAGATKEVVAKA